MKKLFLIILLVLPMLSVAAPTAPKTMFCWGAPELREDGTPISLSEIGGYTLGYGATKSTIFSIEVDIPGGATNCITFTDAQIPDGTFYAAILAYDTDGISGKYTPLLGPLIFSQETIAVNGPAAVPGFGAR